MTVEGNDAICGEWALRLMAGEPPGQDPELARHLGECLRCFRIASEMRDLPRIASLLRPQMGAGLDPGEAFWAELPGRVSARWAGRARGGWVQAGWRSFLGWLRLPLPAALGGATAMAVLTLVLAGRHPAPAPTPAPMAEGTPDEEVSALAAPALLGDDDPWTLLDITDLRSALARVSRDPGRELEDDGTTPTEEVEQLDMEDLPAVALALGKSNRI
jgi:hypothetical protein